jgi:acyl carrier protein
MNSIQSEVRASLARYLGVDPSKIRAAHRLEEDLGVTPLELVLVALDVEEREHVTLPFDQLARVYTVEELLSFFVRNVTRKRRLRLHLARRGHERNQQPDSR